MFYGRKRIQIRTGIKALPRTEKEPQFRNKMYVMIAVLLLGYMGIKSWHIYIAIDAFQGQVLERGTHGAAK